MLTLNGRTCVFEGATGAVGRGAVRELVSNGMNVVMMSHMLADAEAVVEELKDEPGKIMIMGNQENDVCKTILDEFGSIDVFISNTGALDAPVPLEEINMKDAENKMLHQTIGPLTNIQKFFPYLKESSAGRIILMTTAGATMGFEAENILDSMARSAMIGMTHSLAAQLAPYNITVNCVAKSGMVNDHPVTSETAFNVENITDEIPLGHIGTSEEFGALIAYIASEEASFTTGHIFNLTGGIWNG